MRERPSGMTEIYAQMVTAELPESGEYRLQHYHRKEFVFRPGTSSEAIYVVQKGKIRLFMADPDGKEFTINVLGPGDIFCGHTRCFGEAVSDVTVMVVTRKTFVSLVAKHPELHARLIPVLGRSLKNAFDIIEGLVFKACSSRLAWFLLNEAGLRGTQTKEGVLVQVDLTTEQIATRIGATRQTTSTLLNDMIRKGIIVRSRRHFLIRDMDWLRRTSSGQEDA